ATAPDEYAELVSVLFKHLEDTYGLVPDALEITLEPENTNGWSGTQIGKAIVAAATRLHNEGYDPEIVAPSVTNASNAVPYFNDIVAVSGAAAEISMLSYHRYVAGDYAGIFQAADAHGVQTGMMEYFPGNVDHLIEDLTVANASAWEKYAVAQTSAASDYAYVLADITNPSSPSFSATGPTKPLVPFFKYVRMGAVRVGATSNDGAFKPIAFVNENGSYVVVVKANSAGTLNISGLADATYGVFTAANTGQSTDGNDVVASSGALSVSVEAGVTAIYDKAGVPSGGSGGAPGSGGTASEGGSATAGGTASGTAGGTTSAGGTTNAAGSGGTTGVGVASGGTTSGGNSASPMSGGASATSSGNPTDANAGCSCRVPGSSQPSRRAPLAILSIALFGVAVQRSRRARLRSAAGTAAARRRRARIR
ncbi:MAG TPA: glycoside hydrolase family 30 beta sandwich domain-containing protein, partial [Polyangiaceae bacterium]|nr:glycoside hydrolase family 30 beta sandwich domain-containing protein [Polyangiaceae bacterium]